MSNQNPELNVELGTSMTIEEPQNHEPEQSPETAQFVNSMRHSEIVESMSGHDDHNPESNVETTMNQLPQNHEPEQSPRAVRLIFFERRVSLHKAALQGNWENAEKTINECPSIVNDAITEGGETALHLAAAEGHTYFVKQLMRKMNNLHITNEMQNTPLSFAATAGHVHIAKVISQEDEFFFRKEGPTPLFFASWQGHKEMANYLFEKSNFISWTTEDQSAVLMKSIYSGLYDLAVNIVKINKKLAVIEDTDGKTPLQALATKPSTFHNTSRQGFQCTIASTILSYFKYEASNTSAPGDAYKLLDSLWAEVIRQEDIETTQLGAALQMQREILWYKEVEKIVPPSYKNMRNEDGKTPHELFLKEHDRLMKEGEKQIKQIAKSCMLVTTLITTIVFTTAFTAPGGYNNKGAPILRYEKLFMILPISQAIATLASLISMLMFLSVLTSRYLENDFLKSLPLWLVVGAGALFLSIVAMMVAFCSCLFFYKPGLAVMVVLLVLFSSVPITFLILKHPLLISIIRCTYSSKSIFRSKNQLFS